MTLARSDFGWANKLCIVELEKLYAACLHFMQITTMILLVNDIIIQFTNLLLITVKSHYFFCCMYTVLFGYNELKTACYNTVNNRLKQLIV